MRQGYGGFQLGEVNGYFLLILCILVCFVNVNGTLESVFDILHGLFVHGENAVFAACLDRHVCDGEAVVHGELCNAFARELNGLVESAVYADHTDQVQDDVLTADILLQLADKVYLDRGRNLEPVLACSHARCHVGGTNTRGERAERAVSASVRIRTDDAVAGADKTFFGQKRVLDADASYIIEMGDIKSLCKISCGSAELCRLDVLAGGVVVEYDRDSILIKNFCKARVVKYLDGNGGGNIVAEYQIQLCFDQVARLDRGQTRVRREDLLCHCHSHCVNPFY